MSLRDAIALHAPDHKHLIGIVPDDELAARVIVELAEDSVDADDMYSDDEYGSAVYEAKESAKEEIREDIEHILNNEDWDTAEELAKLIREAIE